MNQVELYIQDLKTRKEIITKYEEYIKKEKKEKNEKSINEYYYYIQNDILNLVSQWNLSFEEEQDANDEIERYIIQTLKEYLKIKKATPEDTEEQKEVIKEVLERIKQRAETIDGLIKDMQLITNNDLKYHAMQEIKQNTNSILVMLKRELNI